MKKTLTRRPPISFIGGLHTKMRVISPKRSKYNKRIGKSKICDFCDPKVLEEQECRNLSGKSWKVIVCKYPYLDGNVMIIPTRHLEKIEQIGADEWKELLSVFQKTKKILGKIFETNNFNIGLNLGRGAGASIEHLHWHVIPRNKKVLMNSSNLLADLYIISVPPDKLKIMIEEA